MQPESSAEVKDLKLYADMGEPASAVEILKEAK